LTDDLKFPDDGALDPVIVKGLVIGHVAVNSSIFSGASTDPSGGRPPGLWADATAIVVAFGGTQKCYQSDRDGGLEGEQDAVHPLKRGMFYEQGRSWRFDCSVSISRIRCLNEKAGALQIHEYNTTNSLIT
jgi:hypothetical protein